MTPEQLLFLLLLFVFFLLVPLFNFLVQVFRGGGPDAQAPEPAPRRPAGLPPRVEARPRVQQVAPPMAPAVAPRRRQARARLGPADLRRAVVLAAILEPSRGREPPAWPR